MTFSDLTHKLNNDLLPKMGVEEIVISPDDILELTQMLHSNILIQKSVAVARSEYVRRIITDINTFIEIIGRSNGHLDSTKMKLIMMTLQKMKDNADILCSEQAYIIAMATLSDDGALGAPSKYGNFKPKP